MLAGALSGFKSQSWALYMPAGAFLVVASFYMFLISIPDQFQDAFDVFNKHRKGAQYPHESFPTHCALKSPPSESEGVGFPK